jgi:hypothetical protein
MHPIERLRYVARASGADPSLLVRETAAALADVVRVEPVGLVPACRRLVDRHLAAGPMWWLAARLLTAADPVAEAWTAAAEMEDDSTDDVLAGCLPDEATVTVIGWPDIAAAALRRRGDLEVLVSDSLGDGSTLVRRLIAADVDAVAVPDAGVGAAAVVSDLVLVEALAAGPAGVLAAMGSHAAAAVACVAGTPVWAVAGVGRVLPGPLWDALLGRLDAGALEPWDRSVELVPVGLIAEVVGPSGRVPAVDGLARAGCPVAPELLRAPC